MLSLGPGRQPLRFDRRRPFQSAWRTPRWEEVCAAASDPSLTFSDFAHVLVDLVSELPVAFKDYLWQLIDYEGNSDNPPPLEQRQRDRLPPPTISFDDDELPKRHSYTDSLISYTDGLISHQAHGSMLLLSKKLPKHVSLEVEGEFAVLEDPGEEYFAAVEAPSSPAPWWTEDAEQQHHRRARVRRYPGEREEECSETDSRQSEASSRPGRITEDEADWQPVVPLEREVRRDRPSPFTGRTGASTGWRIYIDDYAEQEIYNDEPEARAVQGSRSEQTAAVDDRYSAQQWAAPSSEDKMLKRQPVAKNLGISTHGPLGWRDLLPHYATELLAVIVFIVSRTRVPRRWLQGIAGRRVRGMQLNRSLAFILHHRWKLASLGTFYVWVDERLVCELLLAAALLPLAFGGLRLRTDVIVGATDASSTAGGIARSVRLSAAGHRALQSAARGGHLRSSDELGIWSWFDGIGAVRQGFVWLRLPIAAYFSVETVRACQRVLSSRWPRVQHLGDINKVDRKTMEELRWKFPRLRKMLRTGGFPCSMDLSGSRSS